MYEEYLYKQELLNTFGKDEDLIDNVQLQLRQKIIDKLKQSAPPAPIHDNLLRKVCNTLFVNYLETHHYHHSLSVFAPEAHFSQFHFSNQELQSMLRVQGGEGQALLQGLVKSAMPKGRLELKMADWGVQTDDPTAIANLQNKLSALDFSYKQKQLQQLKGVESNQLRFQKFKSELNKRFKRQLDDELSRVRNFQIANIRIEEQEKGRLRMKELEEELERNYRAKVEKLREREADVIKRVTQKMKDVESYNYEARQRILRDMENVRAREEELQHLKEQLQVRELQLAGK